MPASIDIAVTLEEMADEVDRLALIVEDERLPAATRLTAAHEAMALWEQARNLAGMRMN